MRSLLLGIGEDTQSLEAHLTNKVAQLLKIGLRLARIAHQEGRTQCQIGNRGTQFTNQSHRLGLCMATQHGRKLIVRDMLEGNIEVFADLRLGGHHLDHLLGEGGRIGIVQANPGDPLNAAQATQQLGQHALAVQINAVVGCILCNDNQLLDTFCGQLARLLL